MKNIFLIIGLLFSVGMFSQNSTINLNGSGGTSSSTTDSTFNNIYIDSSIYKGATKLIDFSGSKVNVKNNLTISDGVNADIIFSTRGASTGSLTVNGYNSIIFGDSYLQIKTIRPLVNSLYDIGISSAQWNNYYTDGAIYNGTTQLLDFSVATEVRTEVNTAYTPSSDQSLLAATQITVTRGIMRVVGNGGAVTLTGTPTIVVATAGTRVIIQGTSDTNTITLQDESNLAGSKLQLSGDVDFTLGQGDVIELIYDSGDANWLEISRSDN